MCLISYRMARLEPVHFMCSSFYSIFIRRPFYDQIKDMNSQIDSDFAEAVDQFMVDNTDIFYISSICHGVEKSYYRRFKVIWRAIPSPIDIENARLKIEGYVRGWIEGNTCLHGQTFSVCRTKTNVLVKSHPAFDGDDLDLLSQVL